MANAMGPDKLGRDWLFQLALIDAPPEGAFDKLTDIASKALGAPVSLISILDFEQGRQFFKSQKGLPEPWATVRETPLSHSFCQHVAKNDAALCVPDARKDARVSTNGAVKDLNVIAYLGVPIHLPDGAAIGALCVIEHAPRSWSEDDRQTLEVIASCVSDQISLRTEIRKVERLRREQKKLTELYEHAPAMIHSIDQEGRIVQVSDHWLKTLGYERHEVLGRRSVDFLTPKSYKLAVSRYFPQFFKNGVCHNAEYQMVCKSGKIVDVLLSAIAEFDPIEEREISFAVLTDVTEWRNVERESKLIGKRYASIVEAQQELICRYDSDLRLTFVNNAYKRFFQRDDLVGRSFLELVPEHAHAAIRASVAAIKPGTVHTMEHEVKNPDGSIGWQQWTDTAITDDNNEIVEYQSVGRDITRRKLLEQEIQRQATRDHLTDLGNRLAFDRELDHQFQSAQAHDGRFALLFLDVDYFKAVNDTFGHETGDELLQEIAQRIRDAVRKGAFVARLGGDEFAIIATGGRLDQELPRLLERIIGRVCNEAESAADPVAPSLSIGVAVFPDDAQDKKELRRSADAALYAAKAAGRGTWRRFVPGMDGRGRRDEIPATRSQAANCPA